MSMFTPCLRYGFWIIDRLNGGLITKHLQDIVQLSANPQMLHKATVARLAGLLTHATATTSFYAPLKGHTELRDYPVTQKRLIRERHSDFLSSAYDPTRLIPKMTSGSYGTPLTFYQTKEKQARTKAEVIFFNRWLGYEPGARFAYVKVDNQKTSLTRRLQNEISMDPIYLTPLWLSQQRHLLHKHEPQFIIGYPSAILAMAEQCRQQGDTPASFSLRGIITIAESLTEPMRAFLTEVFGCEILSRYAAIELGVLGHECPTQHRHHLNTTSFVIELLALNSDEPAAPGELARIVVTDLFSQAMPLIRYDIGDLAIVPEDECPCGCTLPSVARLEGRELDSIYSPDGERVLSLRMQVGVWRVAPNVHQYQFVQTGPRNYVVRVCATPDSASEAALLQQYKRLLGDEASVDLIHVAEIPALPSGKRSPVINEWRKECIKH